MCKILIVVDMQKDFTTGSLANPDAVKIIPNIVKEIESGIYDYIIFTRDTHRTNYAETREGKYLPILHCIEGTPGWEICDELIAANHGASEVLFVDKNTFGYDGWKELLFSKFPECPYLDFTFVGTCTDICVINNVSGVRSVLPESSIKVIANCCAASGLTEQERQDNQSQVLHTMANFQIEIV